MKNLLMTSALVAFGTVPAFAQQTTPEAAPAADSGAFMSGSDEMQISADASASNLIGKRVYTAEAEVAEDAGVTEISQDWEDIGEIGDILLSKEGQVEAVVLDIGGFLGIGERHVALRMDQIVMVNDADSEGEFFLVANLNRESIENAPEFDTASVAQWAGATEQAAENAAADVGQATEEAAEEVAQETNEVATEAATTTETAAADAAAAAPEVTVEESAETAEAAGEEAELPEGEAATLAEGSADATVPAEGATETAATDAAPVTEGTTTEAATETAAADATAETPAPEAGATETAAADAAAEPVTTEGSTEMAAADATATEPTADSTTEEATTETAAADATTEQPATEPVTTEGSTEMAAAPADAPAEGQMMAREGWTTMAAGEMTAEDLQGARLYDVNDELIGEVSELIIDQSGQITEAVLDVGGFLGIGEKSVAIPLEDLQIQTANEGGEIRVYVNATEEELEAMEPWRKEG